MISRLSIFPYIKIILVVKSQVRESNPPTPLCRRIHNLSVNLATKTASIRGTFYNIMTSDRLTAQQYYSS
jgi:hypothetical protein